MDRIIVLAAVCLMGFGPAGLLADAVPLGGLAAGAPVAVTEASIPAAAAQPTGVPAMDAPPVMGLPNDDDQRVASRIAFIQDRLDSRRAHANWWKYGFTGIVGTSLVGQLVRSQLTDDPDLRIESYVGVGSSFLGTVGMFISPVSNGGVANELRVHPATTPEERLQKLHLAEVLLAQTAAGERLGRAWTEWLLAGVVSGSTATLLWVGFDQPAAAARSLAGAVAFSTSRILFSPRHAIRAEADYEATFLRPVAPEISWSIVPYPGGLGIAAAF